MQVNVAGLRRNIKNLAHNYSDAQVKVREATSNDPWGPSATIMAEIAELTNNVVAFSEIMQMIWKRLNDHGKNWRHVYKALILLEYLIKTGNEKVSQQCKENIFAIQTLREFVYFEEGKDQGTHVREKAKQLVNLLKDDERLKNERIKALKAKERFAQYPSGFGSDGYIDGPTQRDLRDMPPGWQEEPAKPVSELEMVRPQTAGEEELQLQLAMAMSREEAEQEEAKRRSDDVRLQLALSQSEQDFKVQKQQIKEEPQSHLLDLLDIQLGATSISSPPLGLAAGGLTNNTSDPWGTPARAASQMSDPWTGTASPPVDPWQPATASRSTPLSSAQMGAVGGLGLGIATNGTNGGEAWGGLRTQSPSVTSGSSTEGWLQTNGNSQNSTNIAAAMGGGAAAVDPWLSKQSVAPSTSAALDPWLSENAKATAAAAVPPASKPLIDDPWAPKTTTAVDDDPWKNIENTTAAKKPSPDMDEFDIITNRNKTGDLLTTNDSTTNISNNNALLLDDLDPLSSTNTAAATTTTNSTGATAKKPLKDPQSFLGENSGLVNLDNLIKPAVPQNTAAGNAAAYNPFSDTVIPPKTNLFQQQQPAVPSINQLKQQSFQMTINQDPWAPVNNTNVAASQLLSFDSTPHTAPKRPTSLNFNQNNSKLLSQHFNDFNSTIDTFDNLNQFDFSISSNLKHSKSDYDAFKSVFDIEPKTNDMTITKESFYNLNTSRTLDNLYSQSLKDDNNSLLDNTDVFNTQNPKTISYSSLYPHVEIVNNNQLYNKSPPSSPIQQYQRQSSTPTLQSYVPYAPLTPLTPQDNTFNINNNYNNHYNNNNQYYNQTYNNNNVNNNPSYINPTTTIITTTTSSSTLSSSMTLGNAATTIKSFGPNYSHALSASLASTPGVTIIPLNSQTSSASNLFNYGFFDSTNDFNNTQYKLENNNNMPWMKPEATASNPFLS